MSKDRGPVPTFGNVNDGHPVVAPTFDAVSERYVKPGSWVSLTQAVDAGRLPVLLR